MMKSNKKDRVTPIIIAGGVIAIVFGICLEFSLPESEHYLSLMSGMFTGAGVGVIAVVIIAMLIERFGNKEKNKQREIERNDERNIQITRLAWTIAACVSLVLCGICGFIFIGLGYVVPGIVCILLMYVEIIVYALSAVILNKKM